MVRFTVSKTEDGLTLDKVLYSRYPDLGRSLLFKLLRKKDIRINGSKIGQITVLHTGDEVIAFFDDIAHFTVIFEDNDTLIVSKLQGIEVQTGSDNKPALINEIRSDYGPDMRLCHRLDRNTGGLIVTAKNEKSEMTWTDAFKDGKVIKKYKCIVHGQMPKKHEILKAYLFKDRKKSIVYIYDDNRQGTRGIITEYSVDKYDELNDISYLTVTLHTGLTHQIRAHLAHIGHPVLADGKYGNPKNPLGLKYQALWSSEITFNEISVKDKPAFR